jgi:Tol biopolymer transport system component
VATGAETPAGETAWRWAGAAAWTARGDAILVPVASYRSTSAELVRVPWPSGAAEPVLRDVDSTLAVNAGRDPSSFVVLRRSLLSSLWLSDGRGGPAAKLTRGEGRYFYGLAFSPSGRILYSSAESGTWDVWTMDPATREARVLVGGPSIDAAPTVSADGRHVVFESNRGGNVNLWRADADGRGLLQLTDGAGEAAPQAAADGWVAFTSLDAGEPTAWRVPIEGGPAVRLTGGLLRDPTVSPDGRWVAGHFRERLGAPWRIAVLSSADPAAAPVRLLDLPGAGSWQVVRWIPGTDRLAYLEARDDVNDIWSWSPDGSKAPLTRFDSGRIFSYAWSPDGTRLASIRGTHHQDVVRVRLNAR